MQTISKPFVTRTSGLGSTKIVIRVRRQAVVIKAESMKIPQQYSQVNPKGDNVFVKVSAVEESTLGGILLPSSAQRRPTTGEVLATGDGKIAAKKPWKFTVKEGESVLYSKFGFTFTELNVRGEEHILIKEDDIIGIMPRQNATADDVPELKPLSDRVLIKVDVKADVTAGGIFLPETAKDKPQSGIVVRVGPGKQDKAGEIKPVKLLEGDRVVYFKHAGDDMETTDGQKYIVVHENDVLCKA